MSQSSGAERRPSLPLYTGGHFDVASEYARWYEPLTTYVDSALVINGNTVEAHWVVRDRHCDPATRPSLKGEITVDESAAVNRFIVDGNQPGQSRHTDGHFNEKVGGRLFPGYMGMGALIALASCYKPQVTTAFRTVKYLGPAFPGETIVAAFTEQQREDRIVINGVVRVNDDPERQHTFARDLQFTPAPTPEEGRLVLAQHQEFEIAAQMAGSVILMTSEGGMLNEFFPIFIGMGPMRRKPVILYAGDTLTGIVTVKSIDKQGCAVDLRQAVNGEEFSEYENIRLGLQPKEWFIKNILKGQSNP